MTVEKRGATAVQLTACALVVLSALLACKNKGSLPGGDPASASESPIAAGAPLTLSWEQPYKLVASGTKGEATFFATRDEQEPALKLKASFQGFPKGTRVKVGSEEGTLGEGSFWSTMVDIKQVVLSQTLDDLKGPVDLGLELSITPPGAPATTTKLQKQNVKESVRLALLKARDGGVSFGADDQPDGKPRGAAVISGYSDLDFVGSAKLLKELDWVIVAENQPTPRASKTCNFKEGPTTLKIFDAKATAYERRSGEKVGEQVIEASSECPMIAFVDKQDKSTKNNVAARDVVAWARTALANGPAPRKPTEQRGRVEPSRENRVQD